MEQSTPHRLSWLAALFATALLCLASYLVAARIASRDEVSVGGAVALPCTPDQVIVPMGDGVVFSDGNTLHALDAGGRQIWSYTAGTGVRFSVYDGGVAAWLGGELSLLSKTGQALYTGTMGGAIQSAKLSTNYAAVLVGNEEDGKLLVLEPGGRQVDEVALEGRTVLDYGFFSAGSLLWVMSADTEGTVPMSTVLTYKPGRMLAGTVTDSDQLIYRVVFRQNELCAVGARYAKTFGYAGDENLAKRLLVYGWTLMDAENAGAAPLMAFAPNVQTGLNPSISDVRMVSGDAERTVRMPFPCFALAVRSGAVYGLSREYAMVCRYGDAKPIAHKLPVPADVLLGITDARGAVLVSGDKVYLVQLP